MSNTTKAIIITIYKYWALLLLFFIAIFGLFIISDKIIISLNYRSIYGNHKKILKILIIFLLSTMKYFTSSFFLTIYFFFK